MAGRIQHFIPQVLQRGFATNGKGGKSQVWVFRKGKGGFLSAVDRVGAQRDFYSNPLTDGANALDDQITDFESSDLQNALRVLRSTSGSIDASTASTVVTHLVFRTAHIRGTYTSAAEGAFSQMSHILDDPAALRRFVGVDAQSDSSIIDLVREELLKTTGTLSPKDQEALARIVTFRLRERFDELVSPSSLDGLRQEVSMVNERLPAVAENAHSKVLTTSLVPQSCFDNLKQFSWEIANVEPANNHFILPDCVAVGYSGASREFLPLFLLSDEEMNAVVMPISSFRILVGTRDGQIPDFSKINDIFARCSHEFFISSENTETEVGLSTLIRSFESNFNIDLLGQDNLATVDEAPRELPRVQIRVPSGKAGHVLKKSLHDLAVQAISDRAAERIQSIWVPANMALALQSLWSRSPTPQELQATNSGAVELVKVNGELKCVILVPRKLAEATVQVRDKNVALVASRLIKINLGRAVYMDWWVRRFPTLFEMQESNLWRKTLLGIALRVGGHYFGGRAAVLVGTESLPGGNRLEDLAKCILDCLEGLTGCRQRFLLGHKNLDMLVTEALHFVEFLLVSVAPILGFLAAKGTALAEDSDAGIVLRQFGLNAWCNLLAKDLHRHYETRHSWESEAELRQIFSHVDRLLSVIGVVVSETEAGHWMGFPCLHGHIR